LTRSVLESALAADTDHVVCFGRDGAERRWPDWVADASRVSAAVAGAGGRRWAIDLDDAYQFAAALVGCWGARKTPVIVSRAMLESGAPLAIDGVLRSAAGRATAAARELVWSRLAAAEQSLEAVAPASQLVLYTSGSTGAPKEVTRCLANVEAELAALEGLWGADLGAARIYSTVSHRHVYGLLFRVLWPLLNRRPFATFDLDYPEQLALSDRRGQALVSSPALLKRIGHLPGGRAQWRAVFSSGGLLTADAAAASARVLGAAPIEVLGSTETSGVAWRRQTPGAPLEWRTLPGVEARSGPDGLLEVRSPFSGRLGWVQMGDIARLVAAGSFELLGRGDHLAKIEDKRLSLVAIERELLASAWVADAAAVALERNARQSIGAVLKLSAPGAAALARLGRRAVAMQLQDQLRSKLEPLALPRNFRYVEEIPTDAQGKRRQATIRALFDQ
jgi:acyl-coenzyme A synthetase/AMP-(fatty) acid ligase